MFIAEVCTKSRATTFNNFSPFDRLYRWTKDNFPWGHIFKVPCGAGSRAQIPGSLPQRCKSGGVKGEGVSPPPPSRCGPRYSSPSPHNRQLRMVDLYPPFPTLFIPQCQMSATNLNPNTTPPVLPPLTPLSLSLHPSILYFFVYKGQK